MQESMEKTTAMIEHFAEVDRILQKHNFSAAKLIPILQEIQDVYNCLSKEVISYVATSIGVPPAKVYGVATFYAHFSLEPKGKHIIRLCDGTACHVKKSHGILNALRSHLKLADGKTTTDDFGFTVETVSCLGACGLAPVMVVDGEVYGQVVPEQAVKIVDELAKNDTVENQQ